MDSLLVIRWIAVIPFDQPGPGARSGRCYRRRVLRFTCLQANIYIYFFNRGTIQLFLRVFLAMGWGRAVRVEGKLSLITGCFLNGPKVFCLKNSVLG